jgi:molybdate transport system ATP-binding protein
MINIDIKKNLFGRDGDILMDINLHIKEGEFLALTGESGSGKTTLLRILAGLDSSNGIIKVENDIWLDDNINLPPQKRDIGFMFQDYALFDNMTILENLLFASDDIHLANKLLKMTELEGLKNRYPNILSGGQKQRVSLCRAMMKKPKILLLDEPLSALDIKMRVKLQNEILSLHKEFNITTIIVSHDEKEIENLASRVVVIEQGKILKDKKIIQKNRFIKGKIIDIKSNNQITIELNDNKFKINDKIGIIINDNFITN